MKSSYRHCFTPRYVIVVVAREERVIDIGAFKSALRERGILLHTQERAPRECCYDYIHAFRVIADMRHFDAIFRASAARVLYIIYARLYLLRHEDDAIFSIRCCLIWRCRLRR